MPAMTARQGPRPARANRAKSSAWGGWGKAHGTDDGAVGLGHRPPVEEASGRTPGSPSRAARSAPTPPPQHHKATASARRRRPPAARRSSPAPRAPTLEIRVVENEPIADDRAASMAVKSAPALGRARLGCGRAPPGRETSRGIAAAPPAGGRQSAREIERLCPAPKPPDTRSGAARQGRHGEAPLVQRAQCCLAPVPARSARRIESNSAKTGTRSHQRVGMHRLKPVERHRHPGPILPRAMSARWHSAQSRPRRLDVETEWAPARPDLRSLQRPVSAWPEKSPMMAT
jgi:hypothetical protein